MSDAEPETPGIVAARASGVPFEVMRTERARSAEESAAFQGIELGTRRLSLPDAEEAREATGYERGAITPFGASHVWPVIADATVGDGDALIAIGGGAHGVNLHLRAADLLKATGAELVDVTEPDG